MTRPRIDPDLTGTVNDLLTPNEYMDLLLERQAADPGPRVMGFPPLLEWFIRDGDEHLVDMAAVETYGEPEKRPTKPRTYRPASHWRNVIERTQKRMDAINGTQRHDTTDPAAYGGVGVRQTARQKRKHWARMDSVAAEYVRLDARLRHAKSMLRKAEARES